MTWYVRLDGMATVTSPLRRRPALHSAPSVAVPPSSPSSGSRRQGRSSPSLIHQ
ncbi:hypothetical protein HanRHA438_Chr05g0239881 [Helianthus annuus]|uniref:Uncharacterized protein n=1 Tax=Helianthus annuus TaxID=4232 RepID=A0A9K3J1S4_HELAN|nr:hypothetical protein HanXRQr2_Chr05g0230671 [Helianthus annuus]KAJ0920310.1 hypothetical protein HanRHA438_Chr05g0239881 [Helianthus annuus]KAJ0923940.1 hypothetical protein HanPSC8_Chr05g0222501 [Helianthus annuus]